MDQPQAPNTPETWTMKEEGGAVELKRGTKEFDEVAATFLATMTDRGRAEVTRVHRVENVDLYENFRLRLAQTARKHARRENGPIDESTLERRLYHGTDALSAKAICSTGFNRSYCTRAVHGKGVYFASRSSYSAHPSFAKPCPDGGTQIILRSRVICGAMAQSSPDYVAPPGHHDSVADNPADPQVVVVFHDAAAYPEYVIEFHAESSQQLLQAQVGAAVSGLFGAGGFGVGVGQVTGGTGGGGFTFGGTGGGGFAFGGTGGGGFSFGGSGSGGGAAAGGFSFGGGNIAQPNGAFFSQSQFNLFGAPAPSSAWPGNANTAPVKFTDGVGAFEALAASATSSATPQVSAQADLGFGPPEPTPYDSNQWMAPST